MKLTKQYILECLDTYCSFDALSEDTFFEAVIKPLQANQCFDNWTWDNGVTKGVLIFKEFDFVIKIPFGGRYFYTESHYENTEGRWMYSCDPNWDSNKVHKMDASDEFYEFEGSYAEDNNWNYCQEEAEISIRAIHNDLGKCLAITEFIGYAQNHPIYAQEKCCMFSEMSSTTKAEEYKNRTATDYDSLQEVRKRTDFWGITNDWVLDFLIYWGEEMLKKLGDFIDDNDISDLHCGNIGYRNGDPCLVDYSSYRD